MKQSDIPSIIQIPFANAAGVGYKNTIPVPSQIGITNGAASYTDGFPPLTMTDLAAGGVPPFGSDFNGILNILSAHDRWVNSGASYPYDSALSAAIGGYPKGAKVINSTGDGFWFSTSDDNTSDPSTDTTGAWVPVLNTGTTTVALSSSNVTLTPSQYQNKIIVLSGALSANIQITFPAFATSWNVIDQTTGAYTVTVKTAAGSGRQLIQGMASTIFCDGSVLWQPYGADQVTFDTFDALRASNTNAPVVKVTAFRVGGKKINAILYKNGTAAQTGSGDSSIRSALASNSFANASGIKYQIETIQIITPFHFGAVGNGTTTGVDAPAFDAAVLFRSNTGGGIVFVPASYTYLFDTVTSQTTNPYYVMAHDNVVVYFESQTAVIKIASGQNAAHAGTTGPNVFATDQTTPLTNFHVRSGKVDWNGASNLLTSSDSARNNASVMSVYGGINCSVDGLWVYETPGNQCVFFPAQSDQGQRDITVKNCRFENGGSGLAGNYNIDHSDVYCNGDGLLYENNRHVATSANRVNGACYELHGNGIARGNKSSNYSRAFWLSANITSISEVSIVDEVHDNLTVAWAPTVTGALTIGTVNIVNSKFNLASGLSVTWPSYAVGGYTAGIDELNWINSDVIGQGYDQAFLQGYMVNRMSMLGGRIQNFPTRYGIQSTGHDLGDGYVIHKMIMQGVDWIDVNNPIYFNTPTLKAEGWNVCHNNFKSSGTVTGYCVTTVFLSSIGFQHSNIIDPAYTGGYTGTANGILTNSLT